MSTNYFALTDNEKRAVIEQVANRIKLPVQAIEKDLWVTTILQILFALPYADKLVFKGGTSLSKVWRMIDRFSEDIDLAIDRDLFGMSGDLTIKQIKRLRKASSLFVGEKLCSDLQIQIEKLGLSDYCNAVAEANGVGDKTYPEPRKIFIKYKSLFGNIEYLLPEVVLEVGARALFEPTSNHKVKSAIAENLPITTDVTEVEIITAVAGKTFLEKAFLLHEIFTAGGNMSANRKSRHLYDLERLMDTDHAQTALQNDELWKTIHHHRKLFTRVSGVNYETDIRKCISIIPPASVIEEWKADYNAMRQSMIYGETLSFEALMERIMELEERFRES